MKEKKTTPKTNAKASGGSKKKTPTANKKTKATEATIVTETADVTYHIDTAAINNADSSIHEIAICNQDGCTATSVNQRITNKFPLDVLHSRLQGIINEANATLGFPSDYLAGSMLTAMAAAIGNTHSVEHMAGWKEYVILFVALVGAPGSNKSHPLSFAMQPLIDYDAEQAATHAEALKRYNAAMELPPKERAANGYEQNPAEPIRKRFSMQDVTPEAVHRILSENPRGLCLISDELAGWFKNFNRYNNGSESEFWMSVFNHKVAMSDRKSSQSGVFIRNPFLCVIGTIQPKILVELAGNNRNANGFMERILYVMPSDQRKVKWNRDRKTPAFDIAAEWKSILNRLIEIVPTIGEHGEIQPEMMPFSSEALDHLFSWQNEVAERCNREGNDTLTSIASKLEIYAVRFCLLLSLSDWACGDEKKEIDIGIVERAISLTEYFRVTAAAVQRVVAEDSLKEQEVAVISDLPERFTTAEGIAIAEKNGMLGRTFQRFLSRNCGILFRHVSHGVYSKL